MDFTEYFNEVTELRALDTEEGFNRLTELQNAHGYTTNVNWDDLENALSELSTIVAFQRAEYKQEMDAKLRATLAILTAKKEIDAETELAIINTYKQIDETLEEL